MQYLELMYIKLHKQPNNTTSALYSQQTEKSEVN